MVRDHLFQLIKKIESVFTDEWLCVGVFATVQWSAHEAVPGSTRCVVNYRELKNFTLPDAYPTPSLKVKFTLKRFLQIRMQNMWL